MTALDAVLAAGGFAARKEQSALFDALRCCDTDGVVAQAGTGVGKSLAILAAAAVHARTSGKPTLVVTPTLALMDQYAAKDAPLVAGALGVTVATLKGRARYLCESSEAFRAAEMGFDISEPAVDVRREEYERVMFGADVVEVDDGRWFGCPGGLDCDADAVCHYRNARNLVSQANIIVTNTHLLIIDRQIKGRGVAGNGEPPEGIFPDVGCVMVDECHALEATMRDFNTSAISLSVAESMGDAGSGLVAWLAPWAQRGKQDAAVAPDRTLAAALTALASWKPGPDDQAPQRRKDAARAARRVLDTGQAGAYAERHAVLWAQAGEHPRLVSSQVNMAAQGRDVLTCQPFALVSATVPETLPRVLGVSDARRVDVGHPFDYRKQARMKVSATSGKWTAGDEGFASRVAEVALAVREAKGGALLLFSSYRDMRAVFEATQAKFARQGLTVLMQEPGVPVGEIAAKFKADGSAVLFGSSTFMTGFDCPGDALRLVVLWKLPYPMLTPVNRAIQESSRARYTDMMRVQAAQACGRLIRTTSDTGLVYIVDDRANKALLDIDSPMTNHLREFRRVS